MLNDFVYVFLSLHSSLFDIYSITEYNRGILVHVLITEANSEAQTSLRIGNVFHKQHMEVYKDAWRPKLRPKW